MEMPSLYTPNQVADYLHVSRGTSHNTLHDVWIKVREDEIHFVSTLKNKEKH